MAAHSSRYAVLPVCAEEQQRGECERKKRRWDSGGCPTCPLVIHIHNAPGDANTTNAGPGTPSTPHMIFPTSPTFEFQAMRDDTVRAYVMWQRSKIRSQEQRGYYDQAGDLTLDHGFDLDLVYTNREGTAVFIKAMAY